MPRPFSRLPEPLAFIRHFTPSWFAMTMGTGVLALVIAHLPWPLPGLSMLAEGLWFVAVGLFALFSLLFLLRLTLYRETIWPMLLHPVQSMFLGAIPMGLAVLISQGQWSRLASLSFNRGDLIMLLAVVDWALYSLLLRRWSAYLQPIPPLALLGVFILLGVPLILPFYLLELGRVGGFALTPSNLAAIGYTAVFASLVAYVGWNHGVKVVGAGRATMVMYLMPVFTALLGWVLLGEALRTFHWIGGALIFAGLLLATRPSFR